MHRGVIEGRVEGVLGSKSDRRRRLVMVGILVLAVCVRCAYIPVNDYAFDQSGGGGELAHDILDDGRWFVEDPKENAYVNALRDRKHRFVDPADIKYAAVDADPHWQPYIREVVGPGLVLAGVWELTGSERYVYGWILQIVIDLGALLLVYRIVVLLFTRRRAAFIAAALYAVCPPIARQTSIVDADIWALYFTIATVALYLEAMRSDHRRWWLLACGVTVGVGTYFRPNVLLLPLALGLASLGWPAMKRPLRGALSVGAIAVALLVPWTIHNYAVFHRFVATRTGAGTDLWQGLGEIHNNFGAVSNDLATYNQVHRVHPEMVIGYPSYDEYLGHRALSIIAQHPLFYAEVVGRRILASTVTMYESAWMYRKGESPFRYVARTRKGLLSYVVDRPLYLLQSAFEPMIFVLAMLTVVFTWRRFRRQHLLFVAIILSALIPYWILHFENRYGLPTLPFYLAWIGLGADLLGERYSLSPRARGRGWLHRSPSIVARS